MQIRNYHKNYIITNMDGEHWGYQYSAGEIAFVKLCFEKNPEDTTVIVEYRTGESYTWKCKYLGVYNGQFGVAVSADGEKVFAQTWENGLFCFDARKGARIWRTKSRRGITSLFVNDHTIVAHQHEHALQLIDMNTGEVLKEKRPATAWGFTALNHQYFICQVTARKWEIIEAETLETVESFAHKTFTNNHMDYVINHISLCEDGKILVKGFKNVWDNSQRTPKMLPNIEFENYVESIALKDCR